MTDVLVLCYHALSPTWTAPLSVTPAAFERQMAQLVSDGWRGATFRSAVMSPPARRTVAITFDDAFASVREHALPILEQFGLPATVFAPTAYVSSGELLGWEGVAHWRATVHADELTPMSWEQLGELAERGWEIGSHTRTHPRLTTLSDDALSVELRDAIEECAERLGRPCDTLAYPYGDVDARVAQRASDAGFVAAAALSSRLEHLGQMRWPRVGIYHGDTGWRFTLKVMRPVRALRSTAVWSTFRPQPGP